MTEVAVDNNLCVLSSRRAAQAVPNAEGISNARAGDTIVDFAGKR